MRAQLTIQDWWYDHRFLRLLAILIVRFSEATRLYPSKIAHREEIELSAHLEGRHRDELNRLYEYLLPDVLRYAARTHDLSRLSSLIRLRTLEVKCKLLLRTLGQRECERRILQLVGGENPLPTWPVSVPDRRQLTRRREERAPVTEQRLRAFGRRRFDAPGSLEAALKGTL